MHALRECLFLIQAAFARFDGNATAWEGVARAKVASLLARTACLPASTVVLYRSATPDDDRVMRCPPGDHVVCHGDVILALYTLIRDDSTSPMTVTRGFHGRRDGARQVALLALTRRAVFDTFRGRTGPRILLASQRASANPPRAIPSSHGSGGDRRAYLIDTFALTRAAEATNDTRIVRHPILRPS